MTFVLCPEKGQEKEARRTRTVDFLDHVDSLGLAQLEVC